MNHKWKPLLLENPPTESGIYAIKTGKHWLYIGRAVNIARRITSKNHPVQITKDLVSLSLTYQWLPISNHLGSVEYALIKAHHPEWNGGTSFAETKCHGLTCSIPMPMTSSNRLLLLSVLDPPPDAD